jgi:hypothetical protein
MRGPKVETDSFQQLLLKGIVVHKPEAMIEFGFQFGEGFATCTAGIPFDKHGRQA